MQSTALYSARIASSPQFAGRQSEYYRFDESSRAARQAEQERLKNLFAPMIGAVSRGEYKTVDYYTSSAIALNGMLRILGNATFPPSAEHRAEAVWTHDQDPALFRTRVADLDRLINRGKLPFDAIVYRGIRSGIPLNALRKGQIITEPGYLSTSPFFSTASESFQHAFKPDGTGNFIFRIQVPKNTPCLNPDTILPDIHLNELLFPRNSQLKITKISREGRDNIVDATLLYS